MSNLGYLIKEGFKNILNNRMMSLASIGVLISCLVLTGSAVMLTVNVTNSVDSVSDSNVTKHFTSADTKINAYVIELDSDGNATSKVIEYETGDQAVYRLGDHDAAEIKTR